MALPASTSKSSNTTATLGHCAQQDYLLWLAVPHWMLANELRIHQAWGGCAPALLLLVATCVQQESDNCPAASPLMALQSCASVACWMGSSWLGM